MNITNQVIILSAESSKNTDEGNRQRTESLKGCLQDIGISFKEALGVFNNEPAETSLVAIVNNDAEYQAVRDFAFKTFDQQAIIHQDANQEAYLVFPNEHLKRLGRLEAVSKEVAIAKGNYTLMGDVYYTTIKR